MTKARILVVEDEAIIARDLCQQLNQMGYDAIGDTPRGEEGVPLAAERRPDLVLMDIHLAGAMDGIAAAEEIRKLGMPVVFLTAYAGDETVKRARITEPYGYLLKPFEERYLRTVIEMALYKHGADGLLRRAHQQYRAILDAAIDAFFLIDWHGRILDVNPAASLLTNYSREELLKRSFSDLDADLSPTRVVQLLENVKRRGAARFGRDIRRHDGSVRRAELSAHYLPEQGGRLFFFARDITDLPSSATQAIDRDFMAEGV
jgi:PAS domain S-box-containing protein